MRISQLKINLVGFPTFLSTDTATTVAANDTSIDLKFSEALAAITDADAERISSR